MRVPQFEPWLTNKEIKAVTSSIESNWITEGPKSKLFSEKLLKLIGAKYGVFAPNGTLALYLGLKALDIGRGDEVIVPDFTMIASATAVEMTGATPVFINVNRKNFQINLEGADKFVTRKTKAIMPVHMFGTVSNMDVVLSFAQGHDLRVIEDAAQALGVHRDGVHAGNFGDVGCFSFFADKIITTGEGGFVVTNNKSIYKKLVYIRNLGRENRGTFVHQKVGYNLRLTDLQASIGLAQLTKLTKIKERKAHILFEYKRQLDDFDEITFFEPDSQAEWIPFRVPILTKYKEDLIDYLGTQDIEARSFFYPLHKQPAFLYLNRSRPKHRRHTDENFPNSVYAFKHGILLPTFPQLNDNQIKYVCQNITTFIKEKRGFFYKYYDVLYKDKDYKAETKMVVNLYRKYGNGKLGNILEIGSGTGNHTKELANLRTDLTAIDIDERMVKIAKSKFKNRRSNHLSILNTSVEELAAKDFDLALALFNVVTYIEDDESLLKFMRGVYKRLERGGVFVFDCWNGVAAIADPPQKQTTRINYRDLRITSTWIPSNDFLRQRTMLTNEIVIKNGRRVEKGGFTFNQTLWTPRQIRNALKKSGFELILNSPFMSPEREARDTDWKIMFVARKPI